MNMGFIYDIIVILIVLFAAVSAMKKGFAYTLVNFAGYIVSLFAALMLSKPIAQMICDKLIAPSVYLKLTESINAAGNNILAGIESYVSSLPGFAQGLFSFDSYGAQAGADASSAATAISNTVIMPVVVNIVSGLMFVIIFSVLLFLVHRVANITKFVKHVPLIGFVNKVLGAAMGIVKGLILAYLFFCVVSLASVWLGASFDIFSPDAIAASYTFGIMDSIKLT